MKRPQQVVRGTVDARRGMSPRLAVSFTADELRRFDNLAREAGVPTSAFIRKMALKGLGI